MVESYGQDYISRKTEKNLQTSHDQHYWATQNNTNRSATSDFEHSSSKAGLKGRVIYCHLWSCRLRKPAPKFQKALSYVHEKVSNVLHTRDTIGGGMPIVEFRHPLTHWVSLINLTHNVFILLSDKRRRMVRYRWCVCKAGVSVLAQKTENVNSASKSLMSSGTTLKISNYWKKWLSYW